MTKKRRLRSVVPSAVSLNHPNAAIVLSGPSSISIACLNPSYRPESKAAEGVGLGGLEVVTEDIEGRHTTAFPETARSSDFRAATKSRTCAPWL